MFYGLDSRINHSVDRYVYRFYERRAILLDFEITGEIGYLLHQYVIFARSTLSIGSLKASRKSSPKVVG